MTTREGGTGEVTGSRIHLEASDGKFYAPSDAYAWISGADDPIFHTSGRFTVRLPVGKASLTVVKGFEYWLQDAEVDIDANEITSLVVDLKPLTDMAAKGWYSGSTHVHMNYAGNLHNTLEDRMMMSEAEDQDIVNEQVANKDNRILDYQFFVLGSEGGVGAAPEGGSQKRAGCLELDAEGELRRPRPVGDVEVLSRIAEVRPVDISLIAAEILVVEHVEQLRDSGDLDSSEIEDLGHPDIDPVEGVAQECVSGQFVARSLTV